MDNIPNIYNSNMRNYVNNFYNCIINSQHFGVAICGRLIGMELNTLLQNRIISQDVFTQLYNQLSKICNIYANLSVFYGRVNINKKSIQTII